MSAVEALPSQSSTTPASLAARDAAHGLYERHSSRILGFCVRRLNTREEAEDAVQIVFVNALRALQRGVVPMSEEAWLFKIAENVCRETHRANSRRRLREVSEPEDLPDPVVRDPETGREIARELVAALEGLPANQRRALLLREWRGFSYREIAADLGSSVGAVETLIFRARRNVAQALTHARGRVVAGLDLGPIVSALKTLFGGATALKLAAAAAVVTVATLPSGDAAQSPPAAVVSVPRTVKRAEHKSRAPRPEGDASRAARTSAAQKQRVTKPVAAPARPDASTGGRTTAPATPPAATPPAVAPPSVQVPPAPGVQAPQVPHVPQIPQIPQVPQVPELPSEVQLPELPTPPEVPVELPTRVEVPELPKLP
jgi:RNA polymerase sigma factor (sigma-70 family)